MRVQRQRRQGSVTVMVSVCLIGMLSFVALSVDGGLIMDNRQRIQSAADAAALAAAEDLFLNWRSNAGLDPNGTAKAAAMANAAANGYPNPTVNIPPLSGPFAGKPGYAEVIITTTQTRYFAVVFGKSNIPISARAVAQGAWLPDKIGILVLNPTAPSSLTVTGGGNVSVLGVPFIVNSSAANGGVATGGGTITASEFDFGGNPGATGSGTWIGPINTNQSPTPDPLAYLPQPDPSTMQLQDRNGVHISNGTKTIDPGVYRGGITVSGQGTLIMNPGIYYMDGGGFSFTGQGNLVANGVMIFNAPQSNSDNISINGSGSISLTPPTSGIYAGISIFQARSASNTVYVSGNGGSTYTGTFYVAGGTLNVTGNGTNNVIGSQYITYNLTVNGNGQFAVNWDANLVSKLRILRLVE